MRYRRCRSKLNTFFQLSCVIIDIRCVAGSNDVFQRRNMCSTAEKRIRLVSTQLSRGFSVLPFKVSDSVKVFYGSQRGTSLRAYSRQREKGNEPP